MLDQNEPQPNAPIADPSAAPSAEPSEGDGRPADAAPGAVDGEGETAAAQRRHQLTAWSVFAILAVAIVVGDQIVKSYVVANNQFDTPSPIVGDWLRIVLIHNSGGLFGIFQNQVQSFAVVSVVVVAFLVALEWRSGWRSWLTTIALGLLLGGAIGNFIDRVTLGYVRDFFDIGIGNWRFYIFNIADAGVTVAIGLLFLIAFVAPKSVFLRADERETPEPGGNAEGEPSGKRLDA